MRPCPHCRAPTELDACFCGNCGRMIAASESHSPTLGDEIQAQPHGTSGQAPTGDLIGREIIGQYVIRQQLGAGGMGEVYLADQPAIGRAVAIKVLHPHLTRGGETARRFQQEAQAAARLQSPHIVQIFNYGTMADGTSFIAMELLAGRTLASVIRAEAPLHPLRAVTIVRQCCEALAEAHAAGVVHRDLKPANLMLVQRGADPDFVKVLDFGVAKLDDGEATRDGAVLGTPQYMSPEQLRSEAIDGRSDLYALGAILYELLCGQPPFLARTAVGYVNLHLNEPPPPLADRVGGLPPALSEAVMRSLAKDPNARPRNASEFGSLLAAAVSGLGASGVGPSSSWSSTGPSGGLIIAAGTGSGGAAGSSAAAVASVSTPTRSPAWVWALVGAVVLVALGTVATLIALRIGEDEADKADAAARLAALEEQLASSAQDSSKPESADPVEPNPAPDPAPVPDPAPEPPPTANDPVPTPTPRPAGSLSPETEALMQMSLAELEAELDRVLDASLMPPSARTQVRESVEVTRRTTPSGAQGDAQLQLVLIQMIHSYASPLLRAKPGDTLAQAKLEEVFMSMDMGSPMTPELRKTVLSQTLATYASYEPAEDAQFLARLAVAALIRAMASDPDIIDGEP